MTVSSTEARITYAGDDSTTSFAVPFTFDADADILVTLVTNSTNNAAEQVLNTDYTISGTNVVMTTAPATGETLIITLGLTFEQATNYIANDPFPAETHEDAIDELAKQIKELKEFIEYRCVKLPHNILSSTTVTDTDIGASKIFRVNAAGDGVELATVNSITNGGDSWSDAVNSSITLDTDSTYDLGETATRFANGYFDNVYGLCMTAAQTGITSLGTLTSLTVDNLTINGNTISADSGNIIIGSSDLIDMGGNTGAVGVPVGTTAQRDTTLGAGAMRWNSTDSKLECYTGSAWVQYTSAGGPGAWSDPVDASITVDTDSTYDLAATAARFANIYADNLYGLIAEAAQTNITSLGTLTTLTVDNITINGNTINTSSGNIEIPEIVDMSGSTDYFIPPKGTTAQRTGSTAGETRYNTTTNKLEYYNGTSWVALEASSGGGLTLLDAQTASASSEIDFTSSIGSTYDEYMIKIINLIPATDGASLFLRVSTDGGSTFKSGASDYQWNVRYYSGVAATGDDADSEIDLCGAGVGNAAGEQCDITLYFTNPSSSSNHKFFHWNGAIHFSAQSRMELIQGAGAYLSASAIDAIRIIMSSGNITSGEFKLYGLQKSV